MKIVYEFVGPGGEPVGAVMIPGQYIGKILDVRTDEADIITVVAQVTGNRWP